MKSVQTPAGRQLVASGLDQTKAYIKAGYKRKGAKQAASRLLTNVDLKARVAELLAVVDKRHQ